MDLNQTLKKFKILGKEKEFNNILESLNDHNNRQIKSIKFISPKTGETLGQNGFNFIHLSLLRSKALIEGALLACENDNELIGFLATRAHFEETGALAYFLLNWHQYADQKITYQELNESLKRLSLGHKKTLGNKIGANDTSIPPIGVMDLIDSVDTFLKEIKKEIAIFRDFYNDLSEFCHPNYLGRKIYFTQTKENEIHYTSYGNKGSLVFLHHINISSHLFIYIYDLILNYLQDNEELPEISKN